MECRARKRTEVRIVARRTLYPSDTPSPVSASEKLVDPGQGIGGWEGIAFVAGPGFAENGLDHRLPVWHVDRHTKPNGILWLPAFGATPVSTLLLLGVRGSAPERGWGSTM